MSRYKCTGGDSRGGIGLVGWEDISLSLKNIPSMVLFFSDEGSYTPSHRFRESIQHLREMAGRKGNL